MCKILEDFWVAARTNPNGDALIWHDSAVTYRELFSRIELFAVQLERGGVRCGDVVLLESEFSPDGVSALMALIRLNAIVVPLSKTCVINGEAVRQISQPRFRCFVGPNESLDVEILNGSQDHPLYCQLRAARSPGLVLFTSGSTGAPKGVVHDLSRLLIKFCSRKQRFRTIAFLLFDHIGGLDTLFYSLSGGSCLIVPDSRTPGAVCHAVAQHRAEVLPVSPSFLNLLLLSESHLRYDLSSLRIITYGAEVMSECVLNRCLKVFPGVKLVQRYGTSELGAVRSHAKGPASLWLKLSGENLKIRVVDGLLQIMSNTAMLGYLNAPSPFTADGWLQTGDCVEQEGEFIRILGRESDVINVGGEKVFPAEIEAVISQMPEVAEVCVAGEKNSIMGNIVVARVRLRFEMETQSFIRRLRGFCSTRLEPFKVPVRVAIVDTLLHNERQKSTRIMQ